MENKELVIRLSALGDVAMTVPVIDTYARQYPDKEIWILTRERFTALFTWSPENVHTIGINVDNYKGIAGIYRLYKELRKYNFSFVADLHDVLRTKILRTFFRLSGVRVSVIDKGRREKKALIGNGMNAEPLKRMQDRYFEVLNQEIVNTQQKSQNLKTSKPQNLITSIGIAPFAAYETKMYPLDKMKQVVDMLADEGKKVYLFGGGKKEKEILDLWVHEGVENMCGKLHGLREELEFMKNMDVMISMDSGNLHLASLMGVRTVSIWGATHPKAGFAPKNTTIIQRDIPCRPCSVYGNKPCHKGTMECMDISPEEIINAVIPRTCN